MKLKTNIKVLIMSVTMALILFIVSANIFIVSVFGLHLNSGTNIQHEVEGMAQVDRIIQAKRGSIIDRNGNILSEDVVAYTLTANIDQDRFGADGEAEHIVDKESAATTISKIIGKDYESVLNILNSDANQVEFGYEGKYLTANQRTELEASGIKGLGFTQVRNRITVKHDKQYSKLIGFARLNDEQVLTGAMGIEQYYNDILTGKNGLEKYQIDKAGNKLQSSDLFEVPAEDGSNVKLTLDSTIQNQLEVSLQRMVEDERIQASSSWGIVMEAKTGRILGMGEYPGFDPNDPKADFTNRVTDWIYEPGSTMKTFTVASAIEEGVWDDDKTYDSGAFYVGDNGNNPERLSSSSGSIHTITNANNIDYGTQSFKNGYAVSSNVMISELMTNYLSYETFNKYLENLGFYSGVQIDDGIYAQDGHQPASDDISVLPKLTTGFGQGMSVSMVEMAQAYTAIMTDGNLVKPYIVDSITNPTTGEVTHQGKTTVLRQVYSASTAQHMRDLMREVVVGDYGSGQRFDIDETEVIAKTGTAEMVIDGAYSSDQFLFSSALGFPYDDPEIIVYTAYVADYSSSIRASAEHVKDVVKATVTVMNLTPENEEVISEIKAGKLKDYTNFSVDKAKQELTASGYNVVLIGDGDAVINQYPAADKQVISNEKIFLATNGSIVTMPDMTGWSYKEVINFWNQSGISIALSGNGFVVSQSINAGTAINNDSEISVKLE